MFFIGNGIFGKWVGEEDFVGKKKYRMREWLLVWLWWWWGFVVIGRWYWDFLVVKDGKVVIVEEYVGIEENRVEGVWEGFWDEVCDEGW